MILKSLFLQNFRNYVKSEFSFNKDTNIVVASNGAGKTNLLEAVFLLSTGRSFKAERYDQMIRFGEKFSRVKGIIGSSSDVNEDMELQIVVNNDQEYVQKKFTVNGVAKHRAGFAGKFTLVLFLPTDLDIVIGNPSARRRFLDDVLEQTDSEYVRALNTYTKALRQRNALLGQAQERGARDAKAFIYWDNLLITHGQVIASKREELLSFINQRQKALFGFELVYDKSEISKERLAQYSVAEMGAGVTLVGPHRDDILIQDQRSIFRQSSGQAIKDHVNMEAKPAFAKGYGEVKYFASRGQQRLVVLELKLAQIAYMLERTGERPMLLLDDIFSELDKTYIGHILEILPDYQTIVTTTHREFVEGLPLGRGNVIELEERK
jgi:DNA replication and repair protein RecF